ncbi:uncharacterized protein LOC132586839 [Heteronotia binoei]|uniref:uncharacterized protein LOC132586839 n=1 Tax=Heteronotia binoei TaxID=13085 RepID=UPI00292F42C0|nr:uncharacterized protein LOC132586839 [Heteronotia binoei]
MADASGASSWLQRARKTVEKSQEWQDFTKGLLDSIQQQMRESHVNTFMDLSEAEKAFVLQKATKAVQGGDSYKTLMSQVSACLEKEIYHQIAQEMQDGGRVKNRLASLLTHIEDGMMTLLEEWPDLKGRLCSLFNQPLPAKLRGLTWRLYLSNRKARLEYLSQRAAHRATSWKDREISLRCQDLLDSEPTFLPLKESKVAARCLRNVLSYYHKLQGTSTPLCEQNYFLPVPLLQAILDTASRSAPESVASASALLVEEFLTFMKFHPWLSEFSTSQSPHSANILEEAASLLEEMDRDLARFLKDMCVQPEEDRKEARLSGVRHVLQPALSTLFVGYLRMDTLLYIWDQIILGLEQPSFNCLPAFAAVFLLLLQDQLLKCQSRAELEVTLKVQGPALSIQEFQDMMGKHFFDELYKQLQRDSHQPFPIHDPTQAFPPWSYRDSRIAAPPRTKPEDRRRMREERVLLKRQCEERMKEEERLQRVREEEMKRQQETLLLQNLEAATRNYEMQKRLLEEQLSQERQFRYEIETKAEEQISRLQAEINGLRDWKMASSETNSAGSLRAPPPSPESQEPTQAPHHRFSLAKAATGNNTPKTSDRENQVRAVTLELLKRMMETASTSKKILSELQLFVVATFYLVSVFLSLVFNGSSAEAQEQLDAATREHLQNYFQDQTNAKIEIFGYEIGEEEIEDIPEPERKEMRKKLEAIIRRGTEARYKAQLAARRRLPGTVACAEKSQLPK